MQELILLPQTDGADLNAIYSRAFERSVELYVLSAYLTNWAPKQKLSPNCKTFRFIIGQDFGITRKKACRNVLRWLPASRQGDFRVAVGIKGFHPKAMFWREADGRMYALVGSSNLTDAAFRTNHEANSFRSLTRIQFERVRRWIEKLEQDCPRVNSGWLVSYTEAQLRGGGTSRKQPEPDKYVKKVQLPRPAGMNAQLTFRREQMAKFKKTRSAIIRLFRGCAKGRVTSEQFYETLPRYWSRDSGRFQGAGFERKGRDANFKQVSQALVAILDAREAERDDVVISQMDWLAARRNPARRAFLSEMLCQLFPDRYPVLDGPVRRFLSAINYRRPRGASEGASYVALAKHLRFVMRLNKDHPAKSLAELDAVIWAKYGN